MAYDDLDNDDIMEDEQEDKREVRMTCDSCGKNLYEDDEYWGNNQIGTFCKECADDEIAQWWGTIW